METREEILHKRMAVLFDEIESLQRDKATLIEVLEWYADPIFYKLGFNHGLVEPARTILAKMKG